MLKKKTKTETKTEQKTETRCPRMPADPVIRRENGYTITRAREMREVNGVLCRVETYTVDFAEYPERTKILGTLRDCMTYIRSFTAKRARGANDQYGTLSLIRSARAIERIATRRGPDLRAALDGTLASIQADLQWQVSMGVDVDAIRATEDDRIAKVRASRTAAPDAQ